MTFILVLCLKKFDLDYMAKMASSYFVCFNFRFVAYLSPTMWLRLFFICLIQIKMET